MTEFRMPTIERKSLLRPTAVEYMGDGGYAINHVQGCSHGCLYPCYAFQMAKRFSIVKSYEEWRQPKLVSNAPELLRAELPRLRDKVRNVHFSFMCDPFMMGYADVWRMTKTLTDILVAAGVPCSFLTKSMLPHWATAEKNDHWWGISLVSLDVKFWHDYEPGAAQPQHRIASLYDAHRAGRRTWVSIEPYPTPNILAPCVHNLDTLDDLLTEISFVDRIVFGRWNYSPLVRLYSDANRFYNECVEFLEFWCDLNNVELIIKAGTDTRTPKQKEDNKWLR